MNSRLSSAIEWGEYYRSLGYNPLPSNSRIGHPSYAYTRQRDEGMTAAEFESHARDGDHNIQLPCGASSWGLVIADLDGELGCEAWRAWTLHRGEPPTVTVRTPRRGLQKWYALRGERMPSGHLFDFGEHQGIEIIGDGKLARVPPSRKDEGEYTFLPGLGPDEVPVAPLPAWLERFARESLRPKPVHSTRSGVAATPRLHAKRSRFGPLTDWRLVRDSVGDKLALAKAWGLRVVSDSPNEAGWVTCRSIFREDRRPSARFHVASGLYKEYPEETVLNLFGVALQLGVYSDFVSAVRDMESTAIGRAS